MFFFILIITIQYSIIVDNYYYELVPQRDYTLAAASLWKAGALTTVGECGPPTYPARPDQVKIVPPHQVPKRGKAGSAVITT